MSLFAEDAYTGPTTIFRSLPQLPATATMGAREDDAEGDGAALGTALPPCCCGDVPRALSLSPAPGMLALPRGWCSSAKITLSSLQARGWGCRVRSHKPASQARLAGSDAAPRWEVCPTGWEVCPTGGCFPAGLLVAVSAPHSSHPADPQPIQPLLSLHLTPARCCESMPSWRNKTHLSSF